MPGSVFGRLARTTARATGRPAAFIAAFILVLAWLVTGPLFHFSDTWQLVINTGTTIVTFLMVFLIQATQNRDTEALHLKLDELIRVTFKAENSLVDLEDASEEEVAEIRKTYVELGRHARAVQDHIDRHHAPRADRRGEK